VCDDAGYSFVGGPATPLALIGTLDADPAWHVRIAAAMAIQRSSHPDVVAALRVPVRTQNDEVEEAAEFSRNQTDH
jgi:hypothetical protein